MTEPNKIFRNVCEENPSAYGDISFTRSYKYTMNRVLKISLCIVGFLCIAFSFIVIGLLLYPYIVGVCKIRISAAENQNNDYYLPSVVEILSGSVICEELDHQRTAAKMQLNVSETETFHDKANPALLSNVECKCPNFSKNVDSLGNDIKNGNETDLLMVGKCVCNETRAVEGFESNETKDESGSDGIKLLKTDEDVHSDSFNVNETDVVDGRHYLPTNACDCEKALNRNGVRLNGTGGQITFAESSECKCPEIFNFDANETMPGSEQHDGPSLDIQKCKCPNIHEDVVINGTETGSRSFDVKHTKDDECICPENLEAEDFITSGTAYSSKKPDIELLNTGNVFDAFNFHKNENESVKESIFLPSELIETDTINLNETASDIEKGDVHSFESNECECTDIRNEKDTVLNGSKVRMFGVKNAEGECICLQTTEIEDINTSIIKNRSKQSDMKSQNIVEESYSANLHLNETESLIERQLLNSDKCICPRAHNTSHAISNGTTANDETHDNGFEGDIECKCPEILEFDNSDYTKTESAIEKNLYQSTITSGSDVESLQIQECECPGISQMLDNGSRVESYMLGVKTVDGKCVCPETGDTGDIPVSKIGKVNEKEMTNIDETESIKEKEMPNDDEAKTKKKGKEKELANNDKTKALKEKEMINIDDTDYVKEKEMPNNDEAKAKEKDKEEELTNNNKAEILKENEMTNIDETDYVKEKDIANDDETETVKRKELTNSDEKKVAHEKELANSNKTESVTGKEMIYDEDDW